MVTTTSLAVQMNQGVFFLIIHMKHKLFNGKTNDVAFRVSHALHFRLATFDNKESNAMEK